ncbi:MAG: hypothetical protein HC887_07335 [Desulfobacteraceae bacterium]|nr:hypothetical protein [Desulfobacteraceae bacterium]
MLSNLPKIDKLFENLTSIPLKSGFVFWLGGGVAWIWHLGGLLKFLEWFRKIKTKEDEISLLICVLFIIMITAVNLLKYLDVFVLRLLEGYWLPMWLRALGAKVLNKSVEKKRNRLNLLEDKRRSSTLTFSEYSEHALLDWELMYIPDNENHRMPTRLGNFLRAVELRPYENTDLTYLSAGPGFGWFCPKKSERN